MKLVERNSTGTEVLLLALQDLNKQMGTYLLTFVQGADLIDLFIKK
jgi:hypothetical protein